MLIVEMIEVGCRHSGSIDTDEACTDFLIGRKGRINPFGDQDLKSLWIQSTTHKLFQAKGRHPLAGQLTPV